MTVECHVCFEPMVQDRKVLALRCGHACCATCLTRWLNICKQANKRCPACRYIPEFGEVPRPVLLRFTGGNAPRTRALVNLNDAIKNAMSLKALVTGLSNAERFTAPEFQTTLADALNIHVAMQDLYYVRELQELMSGTLAYLVALKDNPPRSYDKPNAAKLQLRGQNLTERALQQRLEHKEQRIQALGTALTDQKREYESRLGVSGAVISQLREKVAALEATSAMERQTLRRELEISGQSITALDAGLDKIKASILECKNKIPEAATVRIAPSFGGVTSGAASEKPQPPSTYSTTKNVPPYQTQRSLAKAATAPKPDKHLLPEAPKQAPKTNHAAVPLVEVSSRGPSFDWTTLLNKPISPQTTSDTSTGLSSKPPHKTPETPKPWTNLLNSSTIHPQCATAFFLYYSGPPSSPTITMKTKPNPSSSSGKYRATVTLNGCEISGIADSAKVARRTCAMKLWEIVRKSDVAKWEEFVQAPVAKKFWVPIG